MEKCGKYGKTIDMAKDIVGQFELNSPEANYNVVCL